LVKSYEKGQQMTLKIEIPDTLDAALRARANAIGKSTDTYVRSLLERDLSIPSSSTTGPAFKTGRGSLSQYGPGPSADDIDANRAEMFQNFAKEF
jgi:plasmid stability protein